MRVSCFGHGQQQMSLKPHQIKQYISIYIHKYFILSICHLKTTSSVTAEYYATTSEDRGIIKELVSKLFI